MPSELVERAKAGKLVIFAGAGVSTERKTVFPFTLYEDVVRELGLKPGTAPDFPTVMSHFCKKPNGRQMLLRKIRDRFDYISAFPEIYRQATDFHRELSTIFQIDTILTTNWDTAFESECGAIPYVSVEDFALWDIPGRKVFKIHGSINSLGSIVTTDHDYKECYKRLSTGLIGSVLKTILATKTVLFVGYSFSDPDFQKIHSILTAEMKGFRPHSYIVTVDPHFRTSPKAAGNVTPILTDGAHFLQRLKEHLVAQKQMLSDRCFDGLWELHDKVSSVHGITTGLDLNVYPTAILSASYQDGLLHALERIAARRHTGEYSHECRVLGIVRSYAEIRQVRQKSHSYFDVAYIEGYQNGLLLLLADEKSREGIPIFYVYGSPNSPTNTAAFKKALMELQESRSRISAFCRRVIRQKGNNVPGIVFHHPPFLM